MLAERNIRSQALDLLRFPLAVAIVLVHTMSDNDFVLFGNTFIPNSHEGYHLLGYFVTAFISGQSVPIYYFISGYVFFWGINLDKKVYSKKLKNRVNSLLIPYIVWNLIYVFLYISRNVPFGWREFFMSFWGYNSVLPIDYWNFIFPINYPLWYLRDLMIVVICTPLVNFLVRRFKWWSLLFLGGMWATANLFHWGRMIQLSSAFFFFSLGSYMGINKRDMVAEFGKYFKISIVLYLSLGLLYLLAINYNPEFISPIRVARIFAGLLFAYNLSVFLLEKGYCKVNAFLASSSFFIYLSHAWLFERVRRIIFGVLYKFDSTAMIIVSYLLSVTVTIAILLTIYYIGRKYIPNIFKIMIGGR